MGGGMIHPGDHLIALCREWQDLLGLQSWTIRVRYVLPCDHSGDAQTSFNTGSEIADIRIVDPAYRQSDGVIPIDEEQSLVHELIHIRLWAIDPVEPPEPLHSLREVAIERIARALVELKRRAQCQA